MYVDALNQSLGTDNVLVTLDLLDTNLLDL